MFWYLFFCDVSFCPFTTHYWFAPCHCQDRPMGTSSDWSKIKKSPCGQHPDGQIHVMTTRARRRQRIFEPIQTKHTDTSICEEESVVLVDCFDRWEETIGLWFLRSLLPLHVRLTMMPHFINVLHQNCHRQQMTSVRIIHWLAISETTKFSIAQEDSSERIASKLFDAQAKKLLENWLPCDRRSQ